MKSQSDALQHRLVRFGTAASELSRRIPRDIAGQNIARQLVRSATSPAANYAEAREAESNSDYIHKVKVCIKELRETAVWLAMAQQISHGTLNAEPLEKECDRLTAIFVACLKKARSHG